MWVKPHTEGLLFGNSSAPVRRRLQQDTVKPTQVIFELQGSSLVYSMDKHVIRTPGIVPYKSWVSIGKTTAVYESVYSITKLFVNNELGAELEYDTTLHDSNSGIWFIGGRPYGLEILKGYTGGFAFLDMYAVSVENFDVFAFTSCAGGCNLCPRTGECMVTCCPNQFWNGTDCQRCKKGCESGCVRATDCNLCAFSDCLECTGFAEDQCLVRY